jgi:RNA polymerase sigma-70 factor (ECF subfamily)
VAVIRESGRERAALIVVGGGLAGLAASALVARGGRATAALAPIRGAERVARFFIGLLPKAPPGLELRWVRVNGQPGVMAVLDGQIINALTRDVVDGRVAACDVIPNPDKPARVATA